jgi:hypothetical protein
MDNKKINFFEVLNALNESLYKRREELAKEENDKAGIVISSRIKNITEQIDLFSGFVKYWI